MMEFWREQTLKARKPHKCEMCGGEIKPGEKYNRELGKFDGAFFTRALHIRCAEFEADFCSYGECEFMWDEIYDFIVDKNCRVCPHFDSEDGDCRNGHDIYNCPLLTEKYGKEIENE